MRICQHVDCNRVAALRNAVCRIRGAAARRAHERRRVGAGRIRREPSGTALAGSRPWGVVRPPTARAFMRCLRPELVLRSRVRARMTGVHGPACVRDRACVLVTLVRVCGRPVAPSGG